MKRYGIAAVFAAFIILTIGIYYAQAAADRLPSFRLATQSGDSREAEFITLRGWYAEAPYSEQLEISAAGSRYDRELPFTRRLQQRTKRNIPAIDRLVQAYPDFMRRKPTADYQDGETVARVELMPYFRVDQLHVKYRLTIDLLDKRTKRTRTFEIGLPEKTAFNGAGVIDVQKFDSLLKVSVQYENIDAGGRRGLPEIRVYDIDLRENQIAGSAVVDCGLVPGTGQELSVSAVRNADWTLPNDYLVLEASVMDVSEADAESGGQQDAAVHATVSRQVQVKRELAVYSYRTGSVRLIRLPVEKADAKTRNWLWNVGPYVLNVDLSPEAANIRGYGLSDAKPKYEKRLTVKDLRADTLEIAEIGPNRLYLTLSTAEGQQAVAAIDPADGDVLFLGTVTLDGSEEEKSMRGRIRISSVIGRP